VQRTNRLVGQHGLGEQRGARLADLDPHEAASDALRANQTEYITKYPA